MMKHHTKMGNLYKNEEGATLMEFGIIAGPLMILLLGVMDIGYQGYIDTLSKSIMHQAARKASVGGRSPVVIENEIKAELAPLLLDDAVVTVTVKSYFDFTSIGKPEKLTFDDNKDGDVDPGDCYLDGNNNGIFDINTGNSGTGGPDDIVSYEINIEQSRLFPFPKLFGSSDKITSYNATAVRNQPYGSQTEEPEVCEPVT